MSVAFEISVNEESPTRITGGVHLMGPLADMAPRRCIALSILITFLLSSHLASCTHPSNCAGPTSGTA